MSWLEATGRTENARFIDNYDFSSFHSTDEFAYTTRILFNSAVGYRAMDTSGLTIVQKAKNTVKRTIDLNSLVIASTTVGESLLGTIYNFYYIKVFITIYYLNNGWLNLVQILFAVWNAVNDPLFGCLQDVGFAWCPPWFMNRRKVILYLGPFYALSFMLFWIPWSTTGQPSWLVGLHLLVALFLYDTLFSFALSAQCGLFTESTTEHKGRVRVVVYLEMAALIGGLVILPVDAISKSMSDFRAFQICTGVVAVIASGFFMITGFFASDEVAQMNENEGREKPETAKDSVKGAYQASKGILGNRDFWCVVLGNFCHIMRTTGDANFLAILTEALLSPNGILAVGSIQLSLFYTGCTVLSKLLLIICWPMLQHFGAFVCLMLTLVLSAANCIVTLIVGRTYYTWLALFFLFENILAKGLWPGVYNIFFPDIIDEDMLKHKRKSPLSTLVFTMNALFTKPAYSIAPIIVVAIMNSAGYDKYLRMEKTHSSCNASFTMSNWNNCTNAQLSFNETTIVQTTPGEFDPLFSTMFYIACLYPLACIILEGICFIPYRLKFRHRRDQENAQLNSTTEKEAHFEGVEKDSVSHC